MTYKVVLNELPELLLIASGRRDNELNRAFFTLAVEVLILGSDSVFSISEN
jgi:hypothetical protein